MDGLLQSGSDQHSWSITPGSDVDSTSDASHLADELNRLSGMCRQMEHLPQGASLLGRVRELTRDLNNEIDAKNPKCARLNVASLGRFQLERDGERLAPCPTRRSIAILRYLLTRSDHAAHKSELAEVIWPLDSIKDCAHSLHVAVSNLRRYLDLTSTSCLLFSAGTYFLNPAVKVTDDTILFQETARRADECWKLGDFDSAESAYLAATDGYTGDYCLEDLDFAWAAAERDRHLERYLSALYRLGDVRLRQRRYEAAIEPLVLISQRDCYREDVHYQLMLCYSRIGRRSRAIQQFENCSDLLTNGLSIAPAEKLRKLYELILDSDERSIANFDISLSEYQ